MCEPCGDHMLSVGQWDWKPVAEDARLIPITRPETGRRQRSQKRRGQEVEHGDISDRRDTSTRQTREKY